MMAWSTSELARLAGTTVNAVRHYHRLELLPEPARRHNGYKQYGVTHLLRLLQIRRLVELGIPLNRIDRVIAGADEELDDATLDEVDEELAATIDRLHRARSEIAAIRRDGAPAHTPSGFAGEASRLSAADSSMIHIYSRIYDADAMADIRTMVAEGPTPAGAALDALPADASEAMRERLAVELAPELAERMESYPWMRDPRDHLATSQETAEQAVVAALWKLYNDAQRDVLVRASERARRIVEGRGAST
ncbi:MerR family transcriptional regulator [Microcella daejeonensis]|uniref:MerR family transcriptional regulator n=1 Tax=Microcella daejeonensis TaxID=2994971 RepID=A0A9E8MMT5_9MICO|nr:MerR family transcriptional regulator [Microcella daejeonensis]WAB82558.1 MerR family transcriptional regulator [Microcella daejeonensis]